MTRVRLATAPALVAGGVVLTAAPAAAHGVGARGDLPLEFWQFAWGAAAAVVISFAALGVLWKASRLPAWSTGEPLPGWFDTAVRAIAVPLRLAILALFVVVMAAGLSGTDEVAANLAPITIYVILWVGMQAASAVLGDVWRTLSPYETIAELMDRAGTAFGRPLPESDEAEFTVWPAVAGMGVFLWLELGYHDGSQPRTLGWAMLVYSIAIVVGTGMWGRGWLRSAEAFGVLFSMLALISPFFRDDEGRLRVRRPLSGLGEQRFSVSQVAFVLVVLGSTSFDGFSGSEVWADLVGRRNGWEATVMNTLGLLWLTAIVAMLYIAATRAVATRTGTSSVDAARAFGHSLVPIVLGYSVAHYFSLFVLDGQGFMSQISDPFGRGADWFGTADWTVDFLLIGTTLIAWVQVFSIVIGHVGGVLVAHDRALEIDDADLAIRSQYPMLAVMVVYSVGGLWLLMSA